MTRRTPWGNKDSLVPVLFAETRTATICRWDQVKRRVGFIGLEASVVAFEERAGGELLVMARLPSAIGRRTDISARDVVLSRDRPFRLAVSLALPYSRGSVQPVPLPPYVRIDGLDKPGKFVGAVVFPHMLVSPDVVRQVNGMSSRAEDFVAEASNNPSQYHPSAVYETNLALEHYAK